MAAQAQLNNSLVSLKDVEIRVERHQLDMRRQKSEAMVEMAEQAKRLGRISDGQYFAILHKAAETKADIKVQVFEGKSPTEVAEHFRITTAMLGQIVTAIEASEGLPPKSIRSDERYVSVIQHDALEHPNAKGRQPLGYLIKKKLFELINRACQDRKIGVYAPA
jgi:hypothetical protein